MKRLFQAQSLLLLILLSGCSVLQPDSNSAYLRPDTRIVLPSPTLETPLRRHQLLRFEAGDGQEEGANEGVQESVQALLEADGQELTLVALSPVGVRLFSLHYDGREITTAQTAMDERLPPPGQILTGVMLAYWPLERWLPVLPPGWTLRDQADQRLLLDPAGSRVVEIHYQQAGQTNEDREPVRLIHHHFDYQIFIRRLD